MPNPIPLILLSLAGLALILLPHHRASSHPITLYRSLAKIRRLAPLRRAIPQFPFFLVFNLAALSPLAPAALALFVSLTPPPTGPTSPARLTLALGGLTLIALAALCTFLIFLSGITFAFGGPSTYKRTPLAILIPAYITALGALSITTAAWPTLAALVHNTLADK